MSVEINNIITSSSDDINKMLEKIKIKIDFIIEKATAEYKKNTEYKLREITDKYMSKLKTFNIAKMQSITYEVKKILSDKMIKDICNINIEHYDTLKNDINKGLENVIHKVNVSDKNTRSNNINITSDQTNENPFNI